MFGLLYTMVLLIIPALYLPWSSHKHSVQRSSRGGFNGRPLVQWPRSPLAYNVGRGGQIYHIVQALVISRLDYCNSQQILINLPDTTLHPYTTILHSAARLVKSLKPRDHITPALRQLHWLPIKARISFKICVFMFNIHSTLHVILGQTVHKSRIEIESPLIFQRRLRNPAHVRLIWLTSVRRCWSIRVEQSACLPPSRAIYRIIQNQTKNSSFSNLLRIVYNGHCALNNVKRFRIRLVFSYRRSKKTVVLYCIGSMEYISSLFSWNSGALCTRSPLWTLPSMAVF